MRREGLSKKLKHCLRTSAGGQHVEGNAAALLTPEVEPSRSRRAGLAVVRWPE